MKLNQDSQIVALDSSNNAELTAYNSQMNNMGNYSVPPSTSGSGKDADVRDLFSALARRKWLIMSLALIMAILALIISLAMTPIYRANGVVKIDAESKQLLDYGVEKASSTRLTNEEFMRTQYKILQSRQLARRVIDTLAMEDLLLETENENAKKPFYADFVQKIKDQIKSTASSASGKQIPAEEEHAMPAEVAFLQALRIEPNGKSQLVGISYDAEDPKLAASVVNSLIDNFINMTLDSRVASADHAKVFLSEQLVKAKTNLEESERKLVRYEKAKGIVNTGRPDSLISASLEQLNQAYVSAKRARIDAEAELRQRGGAISGNVRILDNVVIQNLKAELQRLKSKYQENAQIYKSGYPLMREIQGQIKTTEATLAKELRNIKRSVGQDTKANFTAALQKEQELSKELNKAKGVLMSSRDKSLGHNTLLREVQSNREIYEGLHQRMKEVNIAGHVGTNNITKIDSAFVPYAKHTPNTKLNIGLGLIFGFLLGSLIALLLEKMDERIKSVEDLKKLSDLPVLGIFPNTKVKGKGRQAVLVSENPNSAMAEAFRSLRTNMLFSTPEGVPKILHLTSSGPSEGKSNTGINLASVFAQTGKSVLMIDADLRKPSLHKYLQVDNMLGLSDYLSGDFALSEVEKKTDILGLSIITAGAATTSPADFLSSHKMVELLQHVSDKYDFILIDSPPVMGLADALVLSNRSSATLFIVSSHEAKKSHVIGALERLKMGYGNVIGFVLTKAREGKKSGYGYDYDYGDSWGGKSKDRAPRLELNHHRGGESIV
jgi:capsular exopolysaccharide synthesis family protein